MHALGSLLSLINYYYTILLFQSVLFTFVHVTFSLLLLQLFYTMFLVHFLAIISLLFMIVRYFPLISSISFIHHSQKIEKNYYLDKKNIKKKRLLSVVLYLPGGRGRAAVSHVFMPEIYSLKKRPLQSYDFFIYFFFFIFFSVYVSRCSMMLFEQKTLSNV